MGRGKRKAEQGVGIALASGGGRPSQVLPAGLVDSLRAPKERKPRAKTAVAPVAEDGSLSAEGHAVLATLAEQSDRQVAHKEWNRSRVPNGMLERPPGMSESKHKKTLTALRKAGYAQARNGMWWVLPEGRVALGQPPYRPA